MKIKIFLFLTFFPLVIYSQNASTFFPANTGYKWHYKVTPLDSLNQPLNQFATYRVDSFSVMQNYNGLNAAYLPSKRNLLTPNQQAPYSDSTFLNFNGTNGWEYLNLTNGLDSIPFLQGIGIIQFLKSMENWYSVYRFAQTVNVNYTIVSKDTTIQIDTLTLPLRFTISGRRLTDQTINTVLGTFTAKKFAITVSLSYLISFPPLPPIPIPIVSRPDTSYIIGDHWKVKSVAPSSNVDLTVIGVPVSFFIPGEVKELIDPATSIVNQTSTIPSEFKLNQNFPNPFNPSTVISYSLFTNSDVTLKVFDLLGREIASLVNGKQNAGSYSVTFNANGLGSGAYYYRLTANDGDKVFNRTKQMILLK
jgi:hypothetical protein